MPKKEDWDWSSWKNKKSRFLCPYCGNDTINYDPFNKSWRCMKCEESFIRPSKRAPGFIKVLSVLTGWIVIIIGLVYLIRSDPYWVGLIMVVVGILISGLALALVTRWR